MDAGSLAQDIAAVSEVHPGSVYVQVPGISLQAVRELAHRHACGVGAVERCALQHGVCPERYRRNLGTIGIDGQLALLNSRVAVIGAGGLGGSVIECLARMGTGTLVIVDHDLFSESNLNRQLGCTEANLGQPKAAIASERVRQINSALETVVHVRMFTKVNAGSILAGCQVVVDALDNLQGRLVLQRAAAAQGIPMVHGAIAGYTGQVMTIYPGDSGLVGLYSDKAGLEHGVELTLGTPAATPMLVAAWQAAQVIRLLTGSRVEPNHLVLVDTEFDDVNSISM